LNCEPIALVIPRGTKITVVNSINVAKDCQPFTPPQAETPVSNKSADCISISDHQLQEFAKHRDSKINRDLEKDQRHNLLRLLYKYCFCFARDLSELRRQELRTRIDGEKPETMFPKTI
jgi:hypothetical protein